MGTFLKLNAFIRKTNIQIENLLGYSSMRVYFIYQMDVFIQKKMTKVCGKISSWPRRPVRL